MELFRIVLWILLFLKFGTSHTRPGRDCIDCSYIVGAPLPFYTEVFMSQHFNFLFWYLLSSIIIVLADIGWRKIRKK